MTKRAKSRSIRQTQQRPANGNHKRQKEMLGIITQLLITTLALCVIALVAAIMKVESHNFWEVIRAAIGLQGILHGARIINALDD